MDEQMNEPKSKNINDYEILIRHHGDGDFAGYCPQLNLIMYSKDKSELFHLFRAHIKEYISTLD